MFILKHELKWSVSIFSWFLISELPSVVSPIPFDNDDEDCDDGDFELESFSDEILDDDYQMRAYGKYQELDFYMERIVEIQEQLSLANHWFFIKDSLTKDKDNLTELRKSPVSQNRVW